jgi:DNA-binding transcriptional regulator YiaG
MEIARVRELARSGRAKIIRQQVEVSRTDVAQSVEVDPSTIARWEEGRRSPRGAAAIRYGEVLRELTKLTP